MTPTEIKALRVLRRKPRITFGDFAQEMGWVRTPQAQTRLGGRYAHHLQRMGWARIQLERPHAYTHLFRNFIRLTYEGEQAERETIGR